ncbi:MAG: NifU N-terminal domain-containing protein [Planctomycetota bacterium]|nr:NifU N-terminal domain-containing protein [Planctomycetota bacterium]
MPIEVESFQETPNPNAIKCVVDGVPPLPDAERRRSYASPADASGDPVATALFAIPGVTNVLIQPGWITVNKAPSLAWKALKPRIEQALRAAPPHANAG